MNNQGCAVRLQIVSVNVEGSIFFPSITKTNVVVVATISIIHMQNCVFLMLLKI